MRVVEEQQTDVIPSQNHDVSQEIEQQALISTNTFYVDNSKKLDYFLIMQKRSSFFGKSHFHKWLMKLDLG